MRRFGHFLGQVRSWKSGKVARQVGTSAARRFSACFEPLEERQLLAANILASLDGNLLAAGESNQLQLDVAGGPAILGFQMQGTGGTLDPDSVVIKDLSGHTIAPVLADADLNGSTDSLVLAELAPGSYTVTTRGEGSTAGTYHIEACLLGDMDGDGQVDEHELLWTEAATIQSLGGWNHVTQMYYAQFGINLNSNLYAGEIDCDVDGRIDNFDLGLITTNASGAQVTIELIGDITPPDIHADLVNDTGQSDSDGISQEVTIAGTITDDHQIVEFAAGIDGMNRVDYVSLLGDVDAAGHFQLDFAKLEEIAGDSLANNGAHSLFLVAKDEYGNESALYEVPFELDTIAPAAPTGLDLTEASDLGFYNDDDITSDNTPTITIDAETGTMVALHSDIDGMLGESLVNSPVSITATMMSSGVHQLTAVATDAAGNVSAVSASLPIAIDTIAPAVPTLDLATADDTGTVGDQLTEKTSVTLEGVAEVDSRVTLSGYSTTTADATTGAFSFAGLPLVFGPNAFIVTSMDLAGNTSNLTQTIHQNDPPAIGTGVGPITVVEDPGVQSYGLAALFNDPNLASGDTLTLSVLANTNPTLVTPSLSGAQGQIVNSQLQLAFGANQHGSATLTIRATDSYGRTVDAQIVVNVTPDNDAPALVNSATWNCDENSYVQKDLWNYFDDVETADANLLFEIVPGSATLGTVELLTDGHTVRFTADQDVNGTGSFEVKVTDTGDGSSPAKTVHQTFEVVIAAINDPPHADPTTLTTDEDVAVDVDLWTLVDDTETPDDELIFSVGGAQGGSVTLLNGHIAHFVPGENFNGAASFTYSVTDTGDGDQPAETAGPVTINVTVTPVNDAPVAQTDSISTDEDSAVTIDLWDLVDDVETSDANLTFTVGDADHGMVALQADGHHVVFVPTENYSGAASFSYTVTDKDDGSSPAVTVGPTTVSVTVNPVNDAPQAATGSTSTDEDTPVTIDLWTLVSDIETDDADLTFVVSNPSGGTAVLQADNHTVLFTPAQDFNGAAGFEYTVTDKADGSSPAITVGPKAVSVTVNPVNDAPVAQTDSISTDEDTPKTIDLWTLVSDVETDDADLTFV
ncbi:MAG: tandem-95 repeat protein, partial [Pirellulales bacterium]|nr:tandem-95 repeat protein [Pirellulales bacterium]